MKGDLVYSFIVYLLISIIVELVVAITNQFYVPLDKKYEELTPTQKILSQTRLYLNIIEVFVISYVLFNYSKYLNILTIILLVSILIACSRYFLFAKGLIYYFVNKTEKNTTIFNFIEGPIGKIQNFGITILLIYIVIKVFFFKVY